MKKSEQYRAAQLAVLRDNNLSNEEKLEIVGTLMGNESLEKWSEDREEKEQGVQQG